MDDAELLQRIGELAQQEHNLERAHAGEALSGADLEKMRKIEVLLDQCWDLLRQRRARRNAGEDADEVSARPEEVVENYRQ